MTIETVPILTESEWPPGSTTIEWRMERALDRLSIPYLRQREFGVYRVDVWIPQYNVALEAQGCMWHACTVCGYDTGPPGDIEDLREKAARRHAVLHAHGIKVSYIWGHQLRTAHDALVAVRTALEAAGIWRPEWPAFSGKIGEDSRV